MNKFIIKQPPRGIRESDTGKTLDATMYKKDCRDFICLDDGTLVRECRYCNLSLVCRQVDFVNGMSFPMESHILTVTDPDTGEVIENQLYCTGMHDLRSLSERAQDDKIS